MRFNPAPSLVSKQTQLLTAGAYPETGAVADEQPLQLIQETDWAPDLANTITLIGHMGCELMNCPQWLDHQIIDVLGMTRDQH